MMIYCRIDTKYNDKGNDVRNFFTKTAIMLIVIEVAHYVQRQVLPVDECIKLWIYLPVVFVGYFMAQYRIFERLESKLLKLSWVRIISSILVLVLVFVLRR